MLVEDGRSVRLLADPARVVGAGRFYGAAAVGAGVVAGLSLLSGLAALLIPDQPTGVRALAVGFGVAVLLCGGLAWWFGRAVGRVRAYAGQEFLLGLDDAGLIDPQAGLIPWPSVRGVTVTWHPVRPAPPIGLGGRLGQSAARGALRRAHQDSTFRQLTVDRVDGPPVVFSAGAMARDEDFGAFVTALTQRLADRRIPWTVDR